MNAARRQRFRQNDRGLDSGGGGDNEGKLTNSGCTRERKWEDLLAER